MKLDNARRHAKMLECENVRRDFSNSGVTIAFAIFPNPIIAILSVTDKS